MTAGQGPADSVSPDVSTTFTMTCGCGASFGVIEGVEQPHECRPITAQQVRDAWAEGYEFARSEAQHDA